jgi:hypothetical protein
VIAKATLLALCFATLAGCVPPDVDLGSGYRAVSVHGRTRVIVRNNSDDMKIIVVNSETKTFRRYGDLVVGEESKSLEGNETLRPLGYFVLDTRDGKLDEHLTLEQAKTLLKQAGHEFNGF